jgi:pimeloyl-ACP methyl ester carboxylesterase
VRSSSPADGGRSPLISAASFSPVRSSDQVDLAVWRLPGRLPAAAATDRPILLAHATGLHALVWAPLAQRLSRFDAIAPDLRGHGDSTTPTGRDMDWNGFADDVLAVVDAMTAAGIDTAGLVAAGHSKGGAALILAEERRPGTFGALYCYEPIVMPSDIAALPDGGGANRLADGALRRRDVFDSRPAAFENYAGKPPFSALDPEALWAYVDHGFVDQADGSVRLSCRPETESQVFRMGGQHHGFEHLAEITCPVSIAAGATSTFGPAAFASRIAEAIPNGRLVEFPQLGHFGPLEDPALIATSISDSFAAV